MLQLLSDFDVIAVPSWDINGDGRMGPRGCGEYVTANC
jgi:hypothetical protein